MTDTTLTIRCPDGRAIEGRLRDDDTFAGIPGVYEARHPVDGNLFFRLKREGECGVDGRWRFRELCRDVTDEVARLLVARNRKRRRTKARLAKGSSQGSFALRAWSPPVHGNAGTQTPERRAQAAAQGETLALERFGNLVGDTEGAHDFTHFRAPPRLERMYARNTFNRQQYHAALRFGRVYHAAGLEPLRAANLDRLPGNGAGLPDGTLDAMHEVFQVYDWLGGRNTLGARLLEKIVGQDRAVEEALRMENGLHKQRLYGALTAVLDAVAGFYAQRSRLRALERRLDGYESAGNGALRESS